jgi:ABC-type transport system involved in cytochrome c biogenesis permease subunit
MSCLTLMLGASILPLLSPTAAGLPDSLDLETVRGLVVQHDGRWPPLDTLARDMVETVTGESHYRGRDPVLWLLAWTFDPQTWMKEPLIQVTNAELRAELQLPASETVFSYATLMGHPPLQDKIRALAHIEGGRKLDPLESKVSDLNEKLATLQQVFQGVRIKPIPSAGDINEAWKGIGEPRPEDSAQTKAVSEQWSALRKAFLADDAAGFSAASRQLASSLKSLPGGRRHDPKLTAVELRYNRLRPFRSAWMVMVVAALLAAAALLVRRRWFDVVAIVAMVAGFGLLTYGLSLRWQIAGRIPAANMFESLLFLSWGMGAFAILAMLGTRDRTVPLTASVMGAVALLLADCLPLDHFIRPIAPVLQDTIWMSIHVPIIMVSYSVLALAMLIAHAQLVIMAAAPQRRRLIDAADSLHYWYVHVGSVLLIAGIITGSMWAASSWGRYWGWDPKEVWSLVAFLGYLAIMHVRIEREKVPWWMYLVGAVLAVAVFAILAVKLTPPSTGKFLALAVAAGATALFVLSRGQFATAVKSILAFWLIIMTYVGVNYVLGIGLHSYGFGTGAVVRYLFLVGGIDLAIVGLCSIVYAARGGLRLKSSPKGLWQPT